MSNIAPSSPRYTVLPVCGIYFLWKGSEIVYVGKSTDCHFRAIRHAKEGEKHFDSYTILECKPEKLDHLENYYVLTYTPQYNISLPSGGNLMSWEVLAANSVYSKRELRSLLKKDGIEIRKIGRWTVVPRGAVQKFLIQ